MSQENVEVVRDHFAAANEGDFPRAMTHYADDVVLVVHGGPEAGTWEGRDEVGRWFGDWFRSFQRGYRLDLEKTMDLGRAVFVVARHEGRGKASGVEARGSFGYIYRVRDGRIARVEVYFDPHEAHEAAGLGESAVSQENVEVVRQLATAVIRRDLPQLLELTDPRVEWRSFTAALAEGGQYRGHEGIRRYLSDLDETFETFRTKIDDLLGVGDLVVAVGRIHYRGKGSGVETQEPVGWVVKLRDRRVLRVRAFREPEKALDQVGLRV